MKRFKFEFLIFCLLLGSPTAVSQNYDGNGYVKYAPVILKNEALGVNPKMIHVAYNRLNLKYYVTENLTTGMELRNSIQYGLNSASIGGGLNPFVQNQPFINLQKKWYDRNDYLIESEFNRLWLDYTWRQFQIIFGRQRISWGQSWVWNPTDIYNPASALSLDSEEKPGTDAVRFVWYINDLSAMEIAVRPAKNGKENTTALMVKTNIRQVDYQLLGGWTKERYVLGGGWSGEIMGGGFRGEFLYQFERKDSVNIYYNSEKFTIDNRANFSFVISGDYTFENSLYLHSELMYNKNGTAEQTQLNVPNSQYNGDLSPARFSIFGEVSYVMTPLLSGRIFTIVNPTDYSFIIGPSINWSVAQNWDFDATIYQSSGNTLSEMGSIGTVALFRMKWSF